MQNFNRSCPETSFKPESQTPTTPPPANAADQHGSGINHCSSQISEISGESCLTLDTKQLWLGSVLHLVDTLRMPSDSYARVAPQKAERADPTIPPPPELSDGTPVYLYAVFCSSDHCSQTTPTPLMILCHVSDVCAAVRPPLSFQIA